MKLNPAKISGIDISSKMLAIVKKKLKEKALQEK